MLDIRTVKSSKKGIRVNIYRKYRTIDSKTNKVKFQFKQIGSFLLSEKDKLKKELLELINDDELIQLNNWLAETEFAKLFNVDAEELDKFTIRIPPKFLSALTQLYIESKRTGISFIPSEIILNSLLQKSKLAQSKLDKINGFDSRILESVGIDSKALLAPDVSDEESRKLFKELLLLNQPIGVTCYQLEVAAKKLGKEKKIPPPQLKEWAGEMSSRNPDKRIKKWYYAIAIDVLLKNKINPISIIDPKKVAEYWAIQQQNILTLKDAQKAFIKLFEVSDEIKPVVLKTIASIYKKID